MRNTHSQQSQFKTLKMSPLSRQKGQSPQPVEAAVKLNSKKNKSNKSNKNNQETFSSTITISSLSIDNNMTSIRRILVIGLGNPGAQYRDTYHSAGHNVLNGLQKLISSEQPAFASERHGKKATLASIGPKYSLIHSPAIMNVSGPWVAKTYREHLADMGLQPGELGVVLVHDDLEEDLGMVKLRQWARSHRGHNGVKSVNTSLQVTPDLTAKWGRISVGIGRPSERDHSTVADFVLSKMSRHTKEVLEEKGGRGALSALLELEVKNRKLEGS